VEKLNKISGGIQNDMSTAVNFSQVIYKEEGLNHIFSQNLLVIRYIYNNNWPVM